MLTLQSVSGAEPVTLAEAKLAARVDASDLDATITALITAARKQAEQLTGRWYRPQVQRESLVDWPAAGEFVLPVFGATTVAVQYWSGSNWVAVNSSAYAFGPSADFGGSRTEIAPNAGTSWPTLGALAAGPRVRIDITAGPTAPADVPETVKLYIKATVTAWVNNGDGLLPAQLQRNPMLDPLLDSERLWC